MFTKHGGCRGVSTPGPPSCLTSQDQGTPLLCPPPEPVSTPCAPHSLSCPPGELGSYPTSGSPHTVGGTPYVVCVGTAGVTCGSFRCLSPLSPRPCSACPLFQAGCLMPTVRYPGLQLLPLLRMPPWPPVEAHLLSCSLGGYSHQTSWCSTHHQTWRCARLSIALSQVPTWQHPGQYLPHTPCPVLVWTVQGS